MGFWNKFVDFLTRDLVGKEPITTNKSPVQPGVTNPYYTDATEPAISPMITTGTPPDIVTVSISNPEPYVKPLPGIRIEGTRTEPRLNTYDGGIEGVMPKPKRIRRTAKRSPKITIE